MKLFGTDGIRGKANTHPVTAEIALKVGQAAAQVFRNGKRKPKILIGKDTRLSGYMIEYALTSGICSLGADVLLVGPMPTPAIAHLTKSFAADAGIVISASHNSYEDNGIKFFDKNGVKLNDSVEKEIEKLVLKNDFECYNYTKERIGKANRINDAAGRYIEFAKSSIKNGSLEGIKLVIDCANGAAYKIAPLIFKELGAKVIVLNNRPNGSNINENCGAMHPEIIKRAVIKNKFDVGIALDGDADRIIMVDEKGNEVDGDALISIAAKNLLDKNRLNNNTVVTTIMSNLGFKQYLKNLGITVIQTKVGDRYVVEEMKKNNFILGGEQSGHIIFSRYTTTGDGTISGLQILNIMKKENKKLSELIKYKKFPQILKNIKVKEKKTLSKLDVLQAKIKEYENIFEENGRILIRYSGTEKKCRVMVEGKEIELIEKCVKELSSIIKKEVGQ